LCRIIGEKFEEYNINPYTKYLYSETILKNILIESVKENKNIGSSTACLVLLDRTQNILYTANIGDSGYIILRKSNNQYHQIYKSEEQLHSFNFPFQVGSTGDHPNKAATKKHKVQKGDLIIVASDG
jgi:protein phosphatase PTC7